MNEYCEESFIFEMKNEEDFFTSNNRYSVDAKQLVESILTHININNSSCDDLSITHLYTFEFSDTKYTVEIAFDLKHQNRFYISWLELTKIDKNRYDVYISEWRKYFG